MLKRHWDFQWPMRAVGVQQTKGDKNKAKPKNAWLPPLKISLSLKSTGLCYGALTLMATPDGSYSALYATKVYVGKLFLKKGMRPKITTVNAMINNITKNKITRDIANQKPLISIVVSLIDTPYKAPHIRISDVVIPTKFASLLRRLFF